MLIAVLTVVYSYTVRLAGGVIAPRENVLLTFYSSIANFFGPLQSGPGVRAIYLKQKHIVRLREYTLATLLYYAFFAIFSAVFLLIGTRPWWQTLCATVLTTAMCFFVLRWAKTKATTKNTKEVSRLHFSPHLLVALGFLTFLQLCLVTVRYYIELKATGAQVGVGQVVSYTGAANFALFASITPDGVGIREAFLLFSQNIHGVQASEIIKANLLDRACYLLFLALLFLVTLSLHAKQKLLSTKPFGVDE